jgi:hypothetical protein
LPVAGNLSENGPLFALQSMPSDTQPAKDWALERCSNNLSGKADSRKIVDQRRGDRRARVALLLSALLGLSLPLWAGQAESPQPALPEAPQPQLPVHASAPAAVPCPARTTTKPVAAPINAGNLQTSATPGIQPASPPCPQPPPTNWYERFINGPQVKPLTPKEKARLAARNVLDPFNALTILAEAGISVGSDAHSAYGPGMSGFGRYVGVSFTQDLTGEFVSTFLIPSIVHQDPHYHRMPNASIPRRVRHAITQIVWTQGDNGKGMVNYADVVGAAIQDEVNNLYVPGRQTNLPASAARYSIGLATAPIDNFVSEFLPDVARHIHVQVVIIQRVINQVAKTGEPGTP